MNHLFHRLNMSRPHSDTNFHFVDASVLVITMLLSKSKPYSCPYIFVCFPNSKIRFVMVEI